jgi:hypothetical protein
MGLAFAEADLQTRESRAGQFEVGNACLNNPPERLTLGHR